MKHSQLKEIIKKKASKKEFAIVTNLKNGLSEIYEPERSLSKEFGSPSVPGINLVKPYKYSSLRQLSGPVEKVFYLKGLLVAAGLVSFLNLCKC